jgi:hypothetical protein
VGLGSVEDAVERLKTIVLEQPEIRLVWVLGSGMSVPAIPSTAEFSARVLALIARLPADIPAAPPERYRLLADCLRLQKGPIGVRQFVEGVVLEAHAPWPGPGLPDHTSGGWSVPPQQRAMARIVAALPEQQRGPVLTTNFDPLAEAALYENGVRPVSVPAAGLGPVGFYGDITALPVVHLHGAWDKGFPLNTSAELAIDRKLLKAQLADLFQRSVVVVAGYGGWDDAFTQAMEAFLRSSQMGVTECEVIWLHHGEAAVDGVVAGLRGVSALVEYEHVNLEDLAGGVASAIREARLPSIPNVSGMVLVVGDETSPPDRRELLAFANGVEPHVGVAVRAPRLRQTDELLRMLKKSQALFEHTVVLGPTGEGKSVALMQAAHEMAQASDGVDSVVVWLSVGAQVPATDAIAEFRRRFGETWIFADEADVILDRIVDAVRASESSEGAIGRVRLVLAMHSQYAQKLARKQQAAAERWNVVEFTGLNDGDAERVAQFWFEHDLLPASYQRAGVGRVTALMEESSHGVSGQSLFGATLHLWQGPELLDRVRDLLARLDPLSLGGVGFRQIFEAISVVHWAWRTDDEPYVCGIPDSALAMWCGIQSEQVLRLVISPLGREAALARIASEAYVRHPAIAEAVVDAMSGEDYVGLARRLGAVGGQMRAARIPGSHALTQLGQRISGPAAVAAAEATVKSCRLVETRVTLMSVYRQERNSKEAVRLAQGWMPHLSEFPDFYESACGFYVEYAVNAMRMGDYTTALRLACTAVSDGLGAKLDVHRVRYALSNIHNAALGLGGRSATGRALVEDSLDLLRILPGGVSALAQVRERPMPTAGVHQLVANLKNHAMPLFGASSPWSLRSLLGLLSGHDVRRADREISDHVL